MQFGFALPCATACSMAAAGATTVAYLAYPTQPTYSISVAAATVLVFAAVIILHRRIVQIVAVADERKVARVLLGVNVALIGTVFSLGVSGFLYLYVITSNSPKLTMLHVVSFVGLGILCFLFVVWGVGIALNFMAPDSLANLLHDSGDQPATHADQVRRSSDMGQLSLTGWLAVLVSVAAMIVAGIPLVMWLEPFRSRCSGSGCHGLPALRPAVPSAQRLPHGCGWRRSRGTRYRRIETALYQGNQPQGVPRTVLAAPVMGIGLVVFVVMSCVAKVAGLSLSKRRTGASGNDPEPGE